MNKTIILGYLTRDVEKKEIKKEGSPTKIVYSSGIAHTRTFRKQDGSQSKEVMFIDITLFGRTGENVYKYFKSGSQILVEGRLKFSHWKDKQNPDRKKTKHSLIVTSFDFVGKKEAPSINANKTKETSTGTSNMESKNNLIPPSSEDNENDPEINKEEDPFYSDDY